MKAKCIFLILILSLSCKEKASVVDNVNRFHKETNWQLQPSLKFDALCLLNTLTDDPYYLEYYQKDYDYFEPLLTEEAQNNLIKLKKIIKDDAGKIISAFYTLYLSTTEDETLEALINGLDNDDIIKENLVKANFYSENDWSLFQKSKPYLKGSLEFLESIDFETYWEENIKSKANERIKAIEGKLSNFNIVPEIEALLGKPLESNTIEVFMLYYSQPHGIRITGTRFLTDVAWSFSIVMRNAVHEMMHPPYDIENDIVKLFIETVKKDSIFQETFKNRNVAFGYNTEEGLIEEDVVQFLEQIINEKFEINLNPDVRWKTNDQGLHQLASSMYKIYKRDSVEFAGKDILKILDMMSDKF